MAKKKVMSQSQLLMKKKKVAKRKKFSIELNTTGLSPTENQRTYLNFSMV